MNIYSTSLIFFIASVSLAPQFCHGSALGDPGMRRDGLRVAFEAWNFCNEVGKEAPRMGSPRAADCFDLRKGDLIQKVRKEDNDLGAGTPFPGIEAKAVNNTDLYAAEKEKYLGKLCEVEDEPSPWQFWMIMVKNGNYNSTSALCPKDGRKAPPFTSTFPCPGKDCMNQPYFQHRHSKLVKEEIEGSFSGSYEPPQNQPKNSSYFRVTWKKTPGKGSWVFHHELRTSKLYPWLMLYLRADATRGFSGGYPYETRGMLKVIPESPHFKVVLRLDVEKGGGSRSQFYLIDIGSCWKNNGSECDGDRLTDVTRYCEMIINPDTPSWCGPSRLNNCPLYHVFRNNTKVFRNDTKRFPYDAYHVYCAPGNARYLEQPQGLCDAYSNPQPQEIVQLLPHPVWGDYGYPTSRGDGWIGDSRRWELDVGGLSQRLYFYKDPGTPPARRNWRSVDVGTEIYVSEQPQVAKWTVSEFDVIITDPSSS